MYRCSSSRFIIYSHFKYIQLHLYWLHKHEDVPLNSLSRNALKKNEMWINKSQNKDWYESLWISIQTVSLYCHRISTGWKKKSQADIMLIVTARFFLFCKLRLLWCFFFHQQQHMYFVQCKVYRHAKLQSVMTQIITDFFNLINTKIDLLGRALD